MSTSAVTLIIRFKHPVTVAVVPSWLIDPIVELNVANAVTLIGVTDGWGTNISTLTGKVIFDVAVPTILLASLYWTVIGIVTFPETLAKFGRWSILSIITSLIVAEFVKLDVADIKVKGVVGEAGLKLDKAKDKPLSARL